MTQTINTIMNRVPLEYVNMLTGALLCVAGVIAFFNIDVPTSLNWVIFGAMYLVMEEYRCECLHCTNRNHLIRFLFSWIGLMGTIALLWFYVSSFLL